MDNSSLWRRLGALLSAVVLAAATLIAVGALPASAAPGDRDTSFTPLPLNDAVWSVAELTVGANAGKYLIGGFFTDAGGDPATDFVARLNADGTRDTSFTPLILNGPVFSVAEVTGGANAGKYLIGGGFTDAGGDASTDQLARLNADGTRDTSFTPPTLNDTVFSVAEVTVGANAGTYLIGGAFTDAGGDPATDFVARLNTDGTRDTSFTPLTLGSIVASVAELTVGANAGKYLIGGDFTDAGGDPATDFLARLNADGTRDTSFTPLTLNDSLRSVAELTVGANAGKYLIGGLFTGADGDASTDRLARLNADGTRDTSFTPLTLNSFVWSVAELTGGANAGKYLIGGDFTGAGGDAATDYVARLNADGTRDTSFTPLTLNGTVWSVAELTGGANAGKYLIGGDFTGAGGDAATDYVSRLLPQSAVVPKRVQVPLHKCVTPGSTAGSIPRRGSKRLMNPGCVTNAGKTVGVKVRAAARTRGDAVFYRLYCKVGAHKARGVSKNRSGFYCKKGALTIRTYGYKLRLQITWSAPATSRYTAYKRVKHYRT